MSIWDWQKSVVQPRVSILSKPITFTSPSAPPQADPGYIQRRQQALAVSPGISTATRQPPPTSIYVRAAPKTAKPAPTVRPAASTGRSSSSGSGGSGGSSSGGGGIKKSDDKPQIKALDQMIEGFGKARDVKLANIKRALAEQDAVLLGVYSERLDELLGSRKDNEQAGADASFAALANRARERVDLVTEAASVGAGETDQLRAQMQALRNWAANQGDVNRSFYDTQRSVNNAVVDLNADTRTARVNAARQSAGDNEQAWTNYYNQVTDAYTQKGNIEGNPYSNAYKAGSSSFAKAAEFAGKAWSNPGTPRALREWTGDAQAVETRLNNSRPGAVSINLAAKRPEGATLRSW